MNFAALHTDPRALARLQADLADSRGAGVRPPGATLCVKPAERVSVQLGERGGKPHAVFF